MGDDNQNMLSQDEIDALLQGDFGLDDMEENQDDDQSSGIFSAEQMRVLLEIADSSLVQEINVFTDYINTEVVLGSTQQPQVVEGSEIKSELLSTEHVLVNLDLDLGKSGIVLTGMSAAMLTSLMTDGEWTGDPDFEWDDLKLSALNDIFNGLAQKMVLALKNVINKDVVASPPQALVLSGKDYPPEASLLKESDLVQIIFELSIGEEPPSQFRYIISEELSKQLLLAKDPTAAFDEKSEENETSDATTQNPGSVASTDDNAAPPAPVSTTQMPEQPGTPAMDPAMMQQMMQQMMAAQQGQGAQPGAQQGMQMPFAPWQFPALAPGASGTGSGNMDLLKDISLHVTVELGRATMPIGQILELLNGSIVELNKQAGEAVELYVQGKLIARGEVVIIDENFGVRITSIVSAQERMKSMQGLF